MLKLNIKPSNNVVNNVNNAPCGNVEGVPVNVQQPVKLKVKPVAPEQDQTNEKKVKLQVKPASPNNNSETTRKQLTMPTAQSYHHFKDQKDHILNCPGMYVGGVKQEPLETQIMTFSENGNRIIDATITVPPAVERLFLEILSNAQDNVDRSIRLGVDIGTIDVMMDRSIIQITNGGVPIPIEIHPEFRVYVPELIFGTLLSGSNYDKEIDRTGAGVNGLGAKLCNIFSHSFMVNVGDSVRKLEYRQVWNDHMRIRGEPEIKPYKGKSFVTISYNIDFSYFGYEQFDGVKGGYPDEAFGLFARHAADCSFNAKVPVKFNGTAFNYQDISNYSRLYFGDAVNSSIVHYEWPENTDVVSWKGTFKAKDHNIMPTLELCVIDTPDQGMCISYVNGIITREGGVHVNQCFKVISSSILEEINKTIDKKPKKGEKEDKKKITLNVGDVKPHISLVICYRIANPVFTSQSKTSLASPTPKIHIPDKLLSAITRWDLINRLYAALEAKQFKLLSKTDGKKRRHIFLEKAIDANDAGGPKSLQCSLYVTEGKSAMGYAVKAASLIPNGRDVIGIFPMKGKPLNLMNASYEQILNNQEFNDLKEMLGLREGVDYRLEDNFNTLRYGNFIILADSDVDGKHIIGLILNMFHCRYPTLLARGYVMYLRTPIIRVSKGKDVYKFYTQNEYEVWKEKEGPNYKQWKHKYFKGLGSSTDAEVKDDFNSVRVVNCLYDDSSPDVFRLAFDDKLADLRKKWIAEHKRALEVEELKMQPISQFLYYEFVEHPISNVARSIPGLDGLKESQRKAIWGAIKKWGSKKGGWSKKVLDSRCDEFKIARFASFIAEETGYHHGEKCMCDTIVSMIHDFVGTNNLPYFTPDGQTGCRQMSGEDAADPRYTFTRPQRWLPYVFKNEDLPLLTKVIDEGEEQEPIRFLPIIPLPLINGATGVATGHSTFIPNHNPIDICDWYRAKIKGETLPEIIPWYRGFTGTIKIDVRSRRKNPDYLKSKDGAPVEGIESITEKTGLFTEEGNTENIDILGDDHVGEDDSDDTITGDQQQKPLSVITIGTYKEEGNTITVTELPVGRDMHKYDLWLRKLLQEKVILDKRDLSSPDRPYFEIKGFRNPSIQSLRLQRSFGLSNMVLLDNDNRPVKYNNVIDILEAFYRFRLPYYDARRRYIIDEIQRKIDKADVKIRFIRAVLDDVIIVKGRKKSQLIPQMESMGFPSDLLKSVNLGHLTDDDIVDLTNEINELVSQRDNIINTPSSQIWLKDIEDFLEVYNKYYKNVITECIINPDDPTKKKRRRGPIPPKAKAAPRGKKNTIKVPRAPRKAKAAPASLSDNSSGIQDSTQNSSPPSAQQKPKSTLKESTQTTKTIKLKVVS